ncbi:MAG TPA: SPOR domain-containing protein, partial [Gammaproteobacteria bacterium]|nr:SPOR domain-containing protein [Gammaproteobacteria bacterium]
HRSRYPSDVEIPEVPEFKPLPAVDALPIVEPDIPALPVPEDLAPTLAKPATPAVVVAEPVAAKPAAPAVVEKKPVIAPKPVTPPKPAWALQVGSFNDKNNALKMRDEYRGKGFTAYVDEEGGTFRVRIGPELDRQRMEKMQERILRQENIKGMIVTHP